MTYNELALYLSIYVIAAWVLSVVVGAWLDDARAVLAYGAIWPLWPILVPIFVFFVTTEWASTKLREWLNRR